MFGPASPANGVPFAYVTNYASNDVFQYDAGGPGLLAPLSPPTVATGTNPEGMAFSPDGQSLYVTNQGGHNVSQYDVGGDGRLSPKTPAMVAAGYGPSRLAVSPDGQSVYVTNTYGRIRYGRSVSEYDVGGGGGLSPKTPATVVTGEAPFGIAVAPDGQSVYVANGNANNISQFDVGARGVLAPKSPATAPTGTGPSEVAVSPDGRNVYVANYLGNSVSQYNVGAGGKLSLKTPATVPAGHSPFGVAGSPDGQSVYITNNAGRRLSQYDVGARGKLSPKTPATVLTGMNPRGIAVSPDGQSVYVANPDTHDVTQYDVGAGGRLSPKSPPAVSTGGLPTDVAVSPLIRPRGTPGWEGFIKNPASGCQARVQVPYLDQGLVTAYTEVVCPRSTKLTIRSRLRSDYPSADITVDQKGCIKGCAVTVPKGQRFFRLACPKSPARRHHQRYYSDIVLYPGTNVGAATEERSRGVFLSPFCAN
jgi:DNA-binding beta-propeller fold protein YncE